jgi:hypothetical protein
LGSPCGDALGCGLGAVARIVVDGRQIRVGVVVAGLDVVDLVGAGLQADVADALVSSEDALTRAALEVPVDGQTVYAVTSRPSSRHQRDRFPPRRLPALPALARFAAVALE